jgi:hypothetical protein
MTEPVQAAPRLLLDEHVWEGLAGYLRSQGYDAVHLYEVERGGFEDVDQLEYAAQLGRTLLTFNARHFGPLVADWFVAERPHAGIIISAELPIGELRKRVMQLLSTRTSDELLNSVIWL